MTVNVIYNSLPKSVELNKVIFVRDFNIPRKWETLVS